MLVCVFFACFAREPAGAARIRHFLLPLLSRDDDTQTSGASRRENVDVYLLFEIRIETLDPSLRGALATKQSMRCCYSAIQTNVQTNTYDPRQPGATSSLLSCRHLQFRKSPPEP